MLSFMNLPMKIIDFLESNVSPRQIAAGVVLAMFLGFIPWNGAMATLLVIFFFVFKMNRMSMLLTLPLFKLAFISGLYRITEIIGQYLLIHAPFLNGFWAWVTGLPVLAYLDINNTLIAGGLALSAVLTAPVYFVSKKASAILQSKYSQKIKGTKIGKVVQGFKAVHHAKSMAEAGAAATIKKQVKDRVVKKVKSKIFRKKEGPQSFLSKYVNVRGVAIAIIVLLIIQFGTAYFVSPTVSSFIIDAINKYARSKITIDTLRVWPLTLSVTLKGVEVYDPDDAQKRLAKAQNVSVRVSALALLSKRLVFSHIVMSDAELTLEGARGSTFNVQKLGAPAEKKGLDLGSVFGFMQKKEDWFSKVYDMLKKNFSKPAVQKEKEARIEAKKVTKEVEDLPKGELVLFKTGRDRYIFEIKDLDITKAVIHMKSQGELIELDPARVRLGSVAFDPKAGADVALIEVRGSLKKEGVAAGSMDFFYSHGFSGKGKTGRFDIILNDVNMAAIRFVYEDSLPLSVEKGLVTLRSETSLVNDEIDSRNRLALKDYKLAPKSGSKLAFGIVPMPVLCEALNAAGNISVKFDITGTLDRPQYKGLEESLMKIAKPYMANVGESIKKEGISAIGKFLKKYTP